ncbi:MAG TPA: FHA domain-containing protein [Pyrinomonadaceae bacterium]
MICQRCNTENLDGAQYCDECGGLLASASRSRQKPDTEPQDNGAAGERRAGAAAETRPAETGARNGDARSGFLSEDISPRGNSGRTNTYGTRPGAAEQGEAVASPPRAASLGAFGSSSGSHESRAGAVASAGNVSAQQTGAGGGPHAKLVIHRGRSVGKEFPMSEDETQIGRWDADGGIFPDVDLDADDPEAKVSRRHARITRRGEQYFVEDLGSTNGTFINRGRRLLPGDRHPLRDGDEVIVGKTFLRFQVLK